MKLSIFSALTTIGLLAVTFWSYQLSRKVSSLDNYEQILRSTHAEIENDLHTKAQKLEDDIEKRSKDSMTEELEILIRKRKVTLEVELDGLLARKTETEKQISDLERANENLPSKVELDELKERYLSKIGSAIGTYETIETFETEHGTVSFNKSDIDYELVPSSGKLAWIRIGKDRSNLNSKIASAWIDAAIWAKEKQGYVNIEDIKEPTDYGSSRTQFFEKDDMYFKTYYQYTRVQGTYGRHSLQYKFYIEIGSKDLKDQARLETYNEKTGS